MRRASWAIATMLLTLAGAAPASAASVTFGQFPCATTASGFCAEVRFSEGGAAERNLVRVETSITGLEVSDLGTPPVAAGGCTQIRPEAVACPLAPVVVESGGADDELLSSVAGLVARLGEGDDRCHCSGTVYGGPGADELKGRRTADVLSGGAGQDVLVGRDGNDRLLADDLDGIGPADGQEVPAADQVHGGPGTDTVSYESRIVTPVVVDLARRGGEQGAKGEADIYTSIENVRGSRRSDRIRGDRFANVLEGARGNDLVDGLGGNDKIEGAMLRGQFAAGDRDRLRGGSGRDRILAAGNGSRLEGGPDGDFLEALKPVTRATIRCGRGRDVFQTNGQRFRGTVARDCERTQERSPTT